MMKYPTIGEVRTIASDARVLYIGLGDQFDDDRRLVRREPQQPAERQEYRAAQLQFRRRLLDSLHLKTFAPGGT